MKTNKEYAKIAAKQYKSARKNICSVLKKHGKCLTADQIDALKFAVDFVMGDKIVEAVAVRGLADTIKANDR